MLYNRKNLKLLFTLVILSLLVFSCSELEEQPFTQPNTENFYQNESDAISALNAAYARLKSGNGITDNNSCLLCLHPQIKDYLHICIKNLKLDL